MLYNVLLNNGIYTEIAKQGKFINVVLSAGEITVRIRLDNDQVLESQLIAGMAFPVPVGFKSVAFLSDFTQQIKVWLDNLPLTYKPNNIKSLGSTLLNSNLVQIAFGQPQLIANQNIARKKISMYADKEFYIGSQFSTLYNSIKIPPLTVFSVETQAAIFGYSPNVNDKTTIIADLTSTISPKVYATNGGYQGKNINKGFIKYLPTLKKYVYSISSSVQVSDLSAVYVPDTCSTTTKTTAGQYKNGDVVVADNTSLNVISNVDGTLRTVPGLFFNVIYAIDTNPVNDNIAASVSSSMILETGNESLMSTKTHPLSGTTDIYINALKYTKTGRLIISGTQYYAYSDDNGITWSVAKQFPSPIESMASSLSVDLVNGDVFYAEATTGKLFVSRDDGVSFSQLNSPLIGLWSSLTAIEGMFFSGGTGLIANGFGYAYTVDAGKNWSNIDTVTRGGGSTGVIVSPDGLLMANYYGTDFYAVNKTRTVGGLGIKTLEESN